MKDIEIYPSSWYYNACVHGFLEVLAWGLGERGTDTVEEEFLQTDGSVRIPGKLMAAIFSTEDVPAPAGYELRKVPDDVKELKRIAWWWVEYTNKLNFNNEISVLPQQIIDIVFEKYLLGDGIEKIMNHLNELGYKTQENNKWEKSNITQLLSNENVYEEIGSKKNIALIEYAFRQSFSKGKMYQNLTQLSVDKMGFLNSWFVLEQKETGELFCSFCNSAIEMGEDTTFLSQGLSRYIGDSIEKFPNLSWDKNKKLVVCKSCQSIFAFIHYVVNKGQFINSNSILINWYLNRILWQSRINSKGQAFLKALYYDNQLKSTIGAWGYQSIELILFEKDTATVQPISTKLSKLLLIPNISGLLNLISDIKVWDLLIKERFDYFLTLSYKNLRYFITGKNENADPEILSNQNSYSAFLAGNLAKLFYSIKIVENKGGKKMGFIDFKGIRIAAKESPLRITNNADKGVIFRLLELTRLNKSSDVYHLLLRIYIARGEKFPESLAKLFSLNDERLLQTGIYAYIAGLDRSYESLSDIGEES